jgi:hypothetical protein
MRAHFDILSRWAPRVLGGFVCLFFSLFALDATGPVDTLVHLTPVAGLLAVLGIAWRWPGLGGAVFIAVAAAYAVAAWPHPSWVAAIAGPLATVGVLFVASRSRRQSPPGRVIV